MLRRLRDAGIGAQWQRVGSAAARRELLDALRRALVMAAALAEVRAHAGVAHGAAVVAACVRLVGEQGFAFTP